MEFKTKQGKKIIADSIAAFEVIRKEYFPETHIDDWKIVGDGLTTLTLQALLKKGK